MRERLAAAIGPFLGLVLFAAAITILHRELGAYRYRDVVGHLHAIPTARLALALGLTALGYLSLTCYDALAFRWIGHPLRYLRIALASFVAYVLSHNVGLSFLSGSAVRYRMFTSWDVSPMELARVITFNVLTFWLGFLTLGGLTLLLAPSRLPESWHPVASSTAPLGVLLLLLLAVYVGATWRRLHIRARGVEIALPGPRMTAVQIALSCVDWTLAGASLYVLLPSGGPSFYQVLGIFLLSQVAGLMSHVPAGLGVFETALVLLLSPWFSGDTVLGCALAYRIVYYLIPLGVALTLFTGFEVLERRHLVRTAGDWINQWLPDLVPRVFSIIAFAAGAMLLLSGATPAAPGRVDLLRRLLPLPVLEVSHLLGSVVGVGLLLLARALQQRVDAAWGLTLVLIVGGVLASLGKGFDYEEATVLAVLGIALLPFRSAFYRRSSLLGQSFSPSWIAGIALVLIGTVFVVLLAYRHVDYSNELWWQFEADGHAPRSLRALAGGSLALAAFGLARLLRPAPHMDPLPSVADLERAAKIVAVASEASAHLALLGDKRLLFHESGAGFVMYGVQRRSFVSMGDPVGPAEVRRELAWQFRELADRHGGIAVFYEVGPTDLPIYLDLGLQLRKIGEEARVWLADFSLSGGSRKGLRASYNHVVREGYRMEILPAGACGEILAELRAISDQWLRNKNTREKRFSLGRFEPDYLKRCPLALVRRDGRIVAFANIWAPETKEELSIDLMRHSDDAPPGVMDFLFAELLLWGQRQGFRWFGLGMAPLAGFEHHRLSPLWNRLGALLFRHGEHFYNFRGLRAFKDKFDPVWEPRYLASPGGLAVPFVLTDVAALVSGGVAGVVAR